MCFFIDGGFFKKFVEQVNPALAAMYYEQEILRNVICTLFFVLPFDFDNNLAKDLEMLHPNLPTYEMVFLYFKNKLLSFSAAYPKAELVDYAKAVGFGYHSDLLCIISNPLCCMNDPITWILDYVMSRMQMLYKTKKNIFSMSIISKKNSLHMNSVMIKNKRVNLINFLMSDSNFVTKELHNFLQLAKLDSKKIFYCILPDSLCEHITTYGFRLEDFKCILQPFFYTYSFAKCYMTLCDDFILTNIMAKRFGKTSVVAVFRFEDIDKFLTPYKGYKLDRSGNKLGRKKIDPKILIIQAFLQRDVLLKSKHTTMRDLSDVWYMDRQDYIFGPTPTGLEREAENGAFINVHYHRSTSKMLTFLKPDIVEALNDHLTHIIKII